MLVNVKWHKTLKKSVWYISYATFQEDLQYRHMGFVENMAGMGNSQQSMWKGKGSSSVPECCYSGPHTSASVSANERNSALFHLVSLDQELASPKTDTVRGLEGRRGRKRERKKMRRKISVIDRERGKMGWWEGGREETGFIDKESSKKHKLCLHPSHTCCSILTRRSQERWQRVRQPLIGPWWTSKMRGQPLNTQERDGRGEHGVIGQRLADDYPPLPDTHSTQVHRSRALLSHLTAQCLMIINTLKHLRSSGSERTPERDGDERREWSWEREVW